MPSLYDRPWLAVIYNLEFVLSTPVYVRETESISTIPYNSQTKTIYILRWLIHSPYLF